MLTSFRRLPWRTTQLYSVACCRRNITFSAARQAEVEKVAEEAADGLETTENDEDESEGRRGASNSAEMLENFLQSMGTQFKTPQKPNNWLADDRVRYF
jgi:hypothetical protein